VPKADAVPDRRPPGLTLANWDLGGEPSAWAYLHAGELFASVELAPPPQPVELEHAERAEVARFLVQPGLSLESYVDSAPVSGIVVVRGRQIIFERYPRMRPDDRHLLMSVTKAFTSAIVGILERRGLLDLARTADSYIGELAGSGWAGVTVNDVLSMASGIDCLEVGSPGAYTDPGHPFYRFEASLGWRPAGADTNTYDFIASLPSHRPPGQVYEYTSVNTFVLSWLAERVTGLPFAELLGREIWSRGGFEAPAQLCVSPVGTPASHGGMSTTLRDLASFGLLFTSASPHPNLIDAGQLRRIRTGRRPELHGAGTDGTDSRGLPPASRQWDFVTDDGDLFKGGFGGQGLYVSPARELVIAFAGTPGPDGSVNQLRGWSRRLAQAVGALD
jgi:CubicO group peptidase (beta-lactamase class C family)